MMLFKKDSSMKLVNGNTIVENTVEPNDFIIQEDKRLQQQEKPININNHNEIYNNGDKDYVNIKDMIGQMIMIGIKGHTSQDASLFFEENGDLSLGGLILFDENTTSSVIAGPDGFVPPNRRHNIHSPSQLKEFISALQYSSKVPLFVSVDQEG